MTLIAALFVLNRQLQLSPQMIDVLLRLGGKLCIKAAKDGPYLLLSGIARVLQTLALIATLQSNPHYMPPRVLGKPQGRVGGKRSRTG